MSFIRIAAKVVLGFAIAGASIAANAVVIDFDGLDSSATQTPLNFGPGSVLEDRRNVGYTQTDFRNGGEFTEDGFTFSVDVASDDAPPRAVLFDTTCAIGARDPYAACNNDVDLTPAEQGENGISGNILIVQEQGSSIPDDAGAPGGTITLTLERIAPDLAEVFTGFRLSGVSVIDDETFEFLSIIDGVETFLDSISLNGNSETGQLALDTGIFQVGDSLVINYLGSGGIDSLVLAPVPIPAALPLFISALAGLGWTARSRRKHAL